MVRDNGAKKGPRGKGVGKKRTVTNGGEPFGGNIDGLGLKLPPKKPRPGRTPVRLPTVVRGNDALEWPVEPVRPDRRFPNPGCTNPPNPRPFFRER